MEKGESPEKCEPTPIKSQPTKVSEDSSKRVQITDTPKLFYYNNCPNCHNQNQKVSEADEEQGINVTNLFSCPDVTKCACILDTPPLKRKLKLEGGANLVSSSEHRSQRSEPRSLPSSLKRDFLFRSPNAARVLSAFTSAYLSPAPYPLISFESPARYSQSL